jgi:hypothetical protein
MGQDTSKLTVYPNNGISVEINLGIKNNNLNDSFIPVKT